MDKVAFKVEEGIDIDEVSLFDTDRLTPKASGGTYTRDNTQVLDPVDHMKRHDNYRERSETMDLIKTAMDDRRQVMKIVMKLRNQMLAYERMTDVPNPATIDWMKGQVDSVLEKLAECDKTVTKLIKDYAKQDRLTKAALSVKGIGEIIIANMLVYVDPTKARHASSLWSYTGLDKSSHERYEKGVTGGGNKTLRTALYVMAGVQLKCKGPYREVYDRIKTRLSESEKVVKTRNTQGKLIEAMWKDTKPSHRHGAAMRAMIKHFLADYWFVARDCAGLPTDACYAEAILGGNHRTVQPKERGWNW